MFLPKFSRHLRLQTPQKTRSRRLFVVKAFHEPEITPTIHVIQPTDTAIYPPFFEAYTKLCDIPSFITKVDPYECTQTLILPPYDLQMNIIQTLVEIEKQVPIERIKPYLIHYMIEGDAEKVNEMLIIYQQLLHTMDAMQTMVIDVLQQHVFPA